VPLINDPIHPGLSSPRRKKSKKTQQPVISNKRFYVTTN